MKHGRRFLLAGPTLYRALAIKQVSLDGFIVLPPIKRGDVPQLISSNRGTQGTLVVVDGYFHLENLSVGHFELRVALKHGWTVWGMSSMGAIRAAEMHHLGVRGYGKVFERFRDDPDFRDDEVALLHEPGPPYREGSEPLFHLREALADLVATSAIDQAAHDKSLDELMNMWFGERTLPKFVEIVGRHAPAAAGEARRVVSQMDRYRRKALDLLEFIEKDIVST
jgi:hypothetical protein